MNYAISATGLFHRMATLTTTVCGRLIDDVDAPLQKTGDGQAQAWLTKNPHDMCRRCMAKA